MQAISTDKKTDNQLIPISINQENYNKISSVDDMRPFFMSIVSNSDHWMFIASNGGLSAGRKNAEYALFPYYTDDKITESAEITGSKTILRIKTDNGTMLWEPFSIRSDGRYEIERNLYKNIYGNKVLFEELNHDLGLRFRYEWCSSDEYGFVRKANLSNLSHKDISVEILDGIQNIIPQGVESATQNRASNLVDAYKRCELDPASGLGIYALSAIIVDKAEPSEALKANVAFGIGLDPENHLLSSVQLNQFRNGTSITNETDVKGEKGAYLMHQNLKLKAEESKEWLVVANVNLTHAKIVALSEKLQNNADLQKEILQDIERGTEQLIALNAASDGLQCTQDQLRDTRHFANTLFNIMRGGIFDYNYQIERWDFAAYLQNANRQLYNDYKSEIEGLPDLFTVLELKKIVNDAKNPHFIRLATEYLPLKFSRRHGDPSRPWNVFSINTRSEIDGSKILDYQGNWRDIFQNWEALAHSYPEFMEGMIFKFLNASTFDGYNPYRVTKDGFDWEIIEPDDPWSYIGYWGDHQIIYLLKFLEFLEKHKPGKLAEYFNQDYFVYAHVPYKIKPYEDIFQNPKDTIDFDSEADEHIRAEREKKGADGALLTDEHGEIYCVNFIEKILASVLAKLSNLIPEGGIWMNTQRPEWNDANNALVGNGVSMVTLYYLNRFMLFFGKILATTDEEEIKISSELVDFYKGVRQILLDNEALLKGPISDVERKNILDALGQVASDYRHHVYQSGFWGKKRSISVEGLQSFTDISLAFIQHTISANKREDNLYHAYNIMTATEKEVQIAYLSEMLEGQVAVLSSHHLSAQEALSVLDALKQSALFRPDQYSYILYPNKNLPGFLSKNILSENDIQNSTLLQKMSSKGDVRIIEKDIRGQYHFNGNFRNANDLSHALDNLRGTEYEEMAQKETEKLLALFERVFNHKAFTGRSGTFFGYEGLGSIYWHMVSKLLLATQECCLQAITNNADQDTIGRLLEHYYEIQAGIGVHKPPKLYGAFPTDPYSHTPAGRGAQQPGMTGQVKEDILCRFGELGVIVAQGKLQFYPCLLRKDEEFLKEPSTFEYYNLYGYKKELNLQKGTLAFTYCQVPIVYELDDQKSVEIQFSDDTTKKIDDWVLDRQLSEKIFERTGEIELIKVSITEDILK